jgi:hypothetical protein
MIKSTNGAQWFSIPLEEERKYFQKINKAKLSDPRLGQQHLVIIKYDYKKYDHFRKIYNITIS